MKKNFLNQTHSQQTIEKEPIAYCLLSQLKKSHLRLPIFLELLISRTIYDWHFFDKTWEN